MPFRELFVEVAQGLLEAAAIEAEQRKRDALALAARRASYGIANSVVAMNMVASSICKRYGWRNCEVSRSQMDRDVEIGARLLCGHNVVVRLAEAVLADAHEWIVALDRSVDETGRRCYCVPHDEAD